MTNPSQLRYTADHEWLKIEGNEATVGISAYAAEALGDVVFVDLPETGAKLVSGEVCGELESTKSVNDLFAPGDGEVIAVNSAVDDDPSLVNSDPYGDGWLMRVRIDGEPDLLDADAYAELTKSS